MKRTILLATVVVAGLGLALSGGLYAEGPAGLRVTADGPIIPSIDPGDLPPIPGGATQNSESVGDALSQLFWDDGTCEAGIGVGAENTAMMEFDVPTQCTQAGLSVVAVTARINTFTGTAFTLRQSGATPGAPATGTRVPVSPPLTGVGPCAGTATTGTSRFLGTGVAVVGGTANFFAGVYYPTGGYTGRDTSGALGRMWLNCPTCGSTVYSSSMLPTTLRGNLVIRVTVEDANCVPVELQSFSIE
jgi:hypothetical protein